VLGKLNYPVFIYQQLLIVLPNFTAISPIAHVALLQTEMWSGFKFCANIGMKSAKKSTRLKAYRYLLTKYTENLR